MKKIFTEIAFAMMLVICCSSCDKELKGNNGFSSEDAITATIVDGNSKVLYENSISDNKIKLTWQVGDTITLFWKDNSIGNQTMSCIISNSDAISNNGKNARFSIAEQDRSRNIPQNTVIHAVYAPAYLIDANNEHSDVKLRITQDPANGWPIIGFDFTEQSGQIDTDSGTAGINKALDSLNVLYAKVTVEEEDKVYLQFKSIFSVFGFASVSGLEKNQSYEFSLAYSGKYGTTENMITSIGTYSGGNYTFNQGSPQSVSAIREANDNGIVEDLFFSLPTGIQLKNVKFSISKLPVNGGYPVFMADTKIASNETTAVGVCYMKKAEFFCENPYALPGEFTINANGDKVRFSQGNLQYQASTDGKTSAVISNQSVGQPSVKGIWRFATNQWDYIGDGNTYSSKTVYNQDETTLSTNTALSEKYSGWIDLFCWATCGIYYSSAHTNYPWQTSTSTSSYPYADAKLANLSINYTYDWGNNKIINGGDTEGMWRTLTKDEWTYILGNRGNMAYATAQIAVGQSNVLGILLFPDSWKENDWPSDINEQPRYNSFNKFNNKVTLSTTDFKLLEQKGVTFLPQTGGVRSGNVLSQQLNHNRESAGFYHSANYSYTLIFHTHYNLVYSVDELGVGPTSNPCLGCAVRLVAKPQVVKISDVKSSNKPQDITYQNW